MKSSDVVWDDQTLEAWLHDPAHFIPGNTMTIRGIKDEQQRNDLLAHQAAVSMHYSRLAQTLALQLA